MTEPSFDDLIRRYFAGDLDRLERRAFEMKIAESEALRHRFDEAYDRRTARAGLLALESIEPALDECFSPHTLDRYVEGHLDPEETAIVQQHLACPSCHREVEARKKKRRPLARVYPFSRKTTAAMMVAGTAAAAAALVFLAPRWSSPTAPHFRTAERFEETSAVHFRLVEIDGTLTPMEEPIAHLQDGESIAIQIVNDHPGVPLFFGVASIGPHQEIHWIHPRSPDPFLPENFTKLESHRSDRVDVESFDSESVRIVVLVTDHSINTVTAAMGVINPDWHPKAEWRRSELEIHRETSKP